MATVLIAPVVGAQEPAAAEAGLKAVDSFMDTWNTREPLTWAKSLNYPHVRPAVGGSRDVSQSPEEYAAGVDFDRTVATGWDRSVWNSQELIHAKGDKAHVAGKYTRYTKDGEKILTNEITYIATNVDGHWGVQARFAAGRMADSAEVRKATAAAARKVLEDYMTAFNARDPEAWAATLNYPHVRVASGDVTIWRTAEEYAKFDFDSFAERFNWDHSAWKSLRVVQATANAANVALEFTRYDKDGDELATFETLYLVTRQNGHWGIRARSSFAP